jgi:iron complex transport system ATP-binding protein
VLRADSLSLGYPGRPLLEAMTLEFHAGEVWGILGRNGSGKSTLLRTLAGLQPPGGGRILLEGESLAAMSRRRVARSLGVMLQDEDGVFWGSTRDYVMLGRHPHAGSLFGESADDARIVEAELGAQQLGALASRAFATLSGGERQRARAASLFAQCPRALLLDEPLQNLDLGHQVALLERLAAESVRGALVVMVLHDLLLAGRYCDRSLLLDGAGGHAAGTRAEMLDSRRLGALYGYPLLAVEAAGETVFLPGRGRHV